MYMYDKIHSAIRDEHKHPDHSFNPKIIIPHGRYRVSSALLIIKKVSESLRAT